MSTPNNETNMLSDELMAELGDDCVVLAKSRKKGIKRVVVADEFIQSAKKLSASAKKRVLQIEQRKVKEGRLSEVMKVLHENELSVDHRDLMKSTKDIGQAGTYKSTLTQLYKRHKAGLPLNTTEMEMLFPTESRHECENLLESSLPVNISVTPDVIDDCCSDNDPDDDNLLSLMGFCPTAAPFSKLENIVINSSKEVEKPVSRPAALGSSILEQLKNLKRNLQLKDENESDDEAIGQEANESKNQSAYTPNEICLEEIISDMGQVHQRSSTQISTVVAPSSINATEKLFERKVMNVYRNPEIQTSRLSLPICGMEQEIMEAVSENDVIIVCGATGSGKSTQIPQFLYENGYGSHGLIGITQPRRIAATSTAQRVNFEMCGLAIGRGNNGNKPKQHNLKSHTTVSTNTVMNTQIIQSRNKSYGRLKRLKVPFNSTRVFEQRLQKADSPVRNTDESLSSTSESNLDYNGLVGYQIRFDSSTIKEGSTKIAFMTDGILLKEITTDLLLRKYSVVILDEAHERSINTDILIGMLSKTIEIRKQQSIEEITLWKELSDYEKLKYSKPILPLKVIIMSATLKISDFQNQILFPIKIPPVIQVDARQYPVTIHFAKQTNISNNYMDEAFRKIVQIHKRLPCGNILVFLTGKREIMYMCKKLKKKFSKDKVAIAKSIYDGGNLTDSNGTAGSSNIDYDIDKEDMLSSPDGDDGFEGFQSQSVDYVDSDDEADLNSNAQDSDCADDNDNDDDNDIDIGEDGEVNELPVVEDNNDDANASKVDSTDSSNEDTLLRQKMLRAALGFDAVDVNNNNASKTSSSFDPVSSDSNQTIVLKPIVLPLFAMLSQAQQNKIFQSFPPNCRLIIIATNVAETSITIPGVRYVIDCGRQKERTRVMPSGISLFEVKWISQMSAEQRAGRAGRTGPGHCYRMYSSAFFDQHLPKFSKPLILTTPLEDIVLQLKAIGISDVLSFPFPTKPSENAIQKAQTQLSYLGALEMSRNEHTTTSSLDLLDKLNSNTTVSQEYVQRFIAQQTTSKIASIGYLMSKFPLNPRFSKMIISAYQASKTILQSTLKYETLSDQEKFVQIFQSRLMQFSLSLVAVLAERNPFSSGTDGVDSMHNDDDDSDDERHDDSIVLDGKLKNLSIHMSGDSLARLHAFSAFSYTYYSQNTTKPTKQSNKELPSKDVEHFCKQNNLNFTVLNRSIDLREQLSRLTINAFLGHQHDSKNISFDCWSSLSPPNAEEEVFLRQVVMTGFPDNIAKKAPYDLIKVGTRRKRLTAYISCDPSIPGPIYIHPSSALYRKDPSSNLPEYIVYETLIQNSTSGFTYMTNVTIIRDNWIPSILSSCSLLKWSEPLISPTPYYDADADCIKGYSIPKYGQFSWELPVQKKRLSELVEDSNDKKAIGYRKIDEVYRWFARFLLEGKVLNDNRIKSILTKSNLKDSPTIITQMKPLAKVSNLLQSLIQLNISNKSQLLQVLSKNPLFLMEEIQQFLNIEVRSSFRSVWNKEIKG